MAIEDFTTGSTEIVSAKIRKIDGSSEFDLIKTEYTDEPFRSLSLTESLFSGIGVVGNLLISDMHGYGESFNFSGGDILELVVATPLSDADTDVNYEDQEFGLVSTLYRSNFKIELYIDNVALVTDETENVPRSEHGIEVVWNLSLISYESGIKNKIGSPFKQSEFIGKIADEEGEGLVNYYGTKNFENIDIEPTENSVWFKGTHAQYPWSKPGSSPSAIQLMSYLAENSVSKENINACNYMFWQDLSLTWHFRSLDSIIRENGSKELPKFNVTDDPLPKSTLTSFLGTKLINQVEFINSNAYKSFYHKEYPSYKDPYSLYLPTHSKLISKLITYDYEEDYILWNHVESGKLIPESMKYDDIDGNELEDTGLYGYFDLKEYNDQKPTKLDAHKSPVFKTSMDSWQSKFDQTNLDVEKLKKIRNEIIRPSKSALTAYVLKRLLKEKWNVYKYSICCDEQPVNVGNAEREIGYIVGFKRTQTSNGPTGPDWGRSYAPSLWTYYWTPVEVWDREEVILNWNPEDGPNVRGAPIRWNNGGGGTNEHPLIAVRGLTLGEVPSIFQAWNMNEILSPQPTSREFIPGLTGPLYSEEFESPTGRFDYLGPGMNKENIQAAHGDFPNIIPDDEEEFETPANVRSFSVMPIGGYLNFGATFPSSDGLGDVAGSSMSEGLVELGQMSCFGQVVEVFKYNRNQIESAGLTSNAGDYIYMFNAENPIDASPFNAYRIPIDGYDSGITYDPYVVPGSTYPDEDDSGDSEG